MTLKLSGTHPENMARVQERLDFVLSGCQCKQTRCSIKRCKCMKEGRRCGPSCKCINCLNLCQLTSDEEEDIIDESTEETEELVEESDNDDVQEEAESNDGFVYFTIGSDSEDDM